jgi:Zn-dependent peptidase ImmA (M78 family)/DNA-binding XRE family transcriptional regulator
MSSRLFDTWEAVGARIAEARRVAGITQEQLAEDAGFDRTALSKIETGRRQINSLELARIAQALRRPLEWFVAEPPPAILSWRARRASSVETSSTELLLEDLASDVELLQELEVLQEPVSRTPVDLASAEAAVAAADAIRQELALGDGPIDLLEVSGRLGLYAFLLDLEEDEVDGAYLALEKGGVAVINGRNEPGRRRFTLAHEIGHYLAQDEYSADSSIGTSTSDKESLIDVFAIHLQLPSAVAKSEWPQLHGDDRPREVAMILAARFRLSWSAVCAQLRNLELISQQEFARLLRDPPTRADWAELGIIPTPALDAPVVPPAFASAVVRAYKKYDLTAERALEMLRGTVSASELPVPPSVPLEALTPEI